ncbi:MAG: sigma 54-dependent Fis family transcriptional regulator [Polyangiales bacterium]
MTQATRAGPRLEKVRYARARVTVTRGPDTGSSLEAAGRLITIGTSPESDLVLTDDTVSRRHCEIELSEIGFRVRDAGSTNGVRLGNQRVYDAAFEGQVELSLGETTLAITPLAETEDREQTNTQRFGDLHGGSRKMRQLFADLERLAPSQLSVLIEGETGTGKDVVAESIHRASPRADGPYVVFDCSAVAPTLIESELFGHEKGAFTGAAGARAGVFEEADGGTLFLDEIGELPKELQPKLLRALERHEIKRLGGSKTISVDVRVLAATNRNLASEVTRGKFRQDLYYRIAAAKVAVPPLRDRLDDIPMLVERFLTLDKHALSIRAVPEQVWQMFAAHRWPGNVRELRNAVQRMVIAPELSLHSDEGFGAQRPVTEPDVATVEPLRVARRDAAEAFERSYLESVLKRTGGNVTRAAAIAEVSRQMIQKLMRKHDIT